MFYDFVFEYENLVKIAKKSDAKLQFLLHILSDRAGRYKLEKNIFLEKIDIYNFRIHFVLNCADTKQILDFSSSLNEYLPLSLEYKFISINTLESLPKKDENLSKITIKKDMKFDILSPKEFYEISNIDSKKYCKINGISIDNKMTKNANQIKNLIDKIVLEILNKNEVTIQYKNISMTLSLAKTPKVMMCDIASLKTFFRLSNAQSEVLSTIEKPQSNLFPKEIFKDNFMLDSVGSVSVTLPKDIFSAIICKKLLENNIEFCFVKYTKIKSNIAIDRTIENQELIISLAGANIPNNTSPKIKNLNALIQSNLKGRIENKAMIFYLNLDRASAILLYDIKTQKYQNILEINYDANPKNILKHIELDYENGDTLINNFKEKFSQTYEKINRFDTNKMPSKNLLDIFSVASLLLDDSFDKMSFISIANKCVREKGPRIDYKLENIDGKLHLDIPRIFRSIISFRLAGVENELLAFGVIDSLSEFLSTLARDFKTNLEVEDLLFCGRYFTHAMALEKLIYYIPQNHNVLLPRILESSV